MDYLAGSYQATLESRLSAAEDHLPNGGLANRVTEHGNRLTSLEAWRSNKSPASPNLATATNLPTALVAGLLTTITKAGVEAEFTKIKVDLADIKGVLRAREMMH